MELLGTTKVTAVTPSTAAAKPTARAMVRWEAGTLWEDEPGPPDHEILTILPSERFGWYDLQDDFTEELSSTTFSSLKNRVTPNSRTETGRAVAC